ncbi:MAG: cupredoxin domain-containing protein [Patescibacteria group bacterium]
MKKYFLLGLLALLPFTLAACTKATNTNTVTINLTNTAAINTSAVNTNVANANVHAVTNANASTSTNTTNANTAAVPTETAVSVTAAGYSPATITVKAGTTVIWTNRSGDTVRVASDPHPTHTDLPGLESSNLSNGETYSFTFTQVGTWGYHNHFSPTTRGTVIVQ